MKDVDLKCLKLTKPAVTSLLTYNNKTLTFASFKIFSGDVLKEPRSKTVILLLFLFKLFDNNSATCTNQSQKQTPSYHLADYIILK